jgi:hypothetical protein
VRRPQRSQTTPKLGRDGVSLVLSSAVIKVIELRNKSEESDAYATTSTETAGHDHHSYATRSKYENSHTQKDPGREEAMEIKSPKRKPQKQRE